MTLLPILMLAAGLNTAATPAVPAHARQAEAALNRLVTLAEPTLNRRTLDQALTESTHAFNRTANRAPRLAPSARQTEVNMNRLVNEAQAKLAARAINTALATSLHGYKRSLAGEIAHSAATYEIAGQAAVKSAAKTVPLSLQ